MILRISGGGRSIQTSTTSSPAIAPDFSFLPLRASGMAPAVRRGELSTPVDRSILSLVPSETSSLRSLCENKLNG
jgi:hypothetical protein